MTPFTPTDEQKADLALFYMHLPRGGMDVDHFADDLIASPAFQAIIRAAQAEVLREYAAERYEAFLEDPDTPSHAHKPGSLAWRYKSAAESLRSHADRTENGTVS